MGLFSKLFGKKEATPTVHKRKDQPDVFDIRSEDEKMNWAIKKANLTLHYFEDCLKNPQVNHQYFSIKVKIIDGEMSEHIWLNNSTFDEEGNLFGIVGNDPINVKNVKMGQKVGIDRSNISDWMIIDNGRLIGGYTIRALRDNYTGADLENFDKNLGGMIVDDGEDYFVADNSTPEGAILLLEEAFDADDIEKAIACKDFNVEAELMLSKMGKEDLGQEVIDKMSEVLRLSFEKSLQENGMPKFKDIKRAFPKREKLSDKHMIITETCYYPDGTFSRQRLNTYKTDNGWKVLNPAD